MKIGHPLRAWRAGRFARSLGYQALPQRCANCPGFMVKHRDTGEVICINELLAREKWS